MGLIKIGDVAQLIRGVSYVKNDASTEKRTGYIAILRANNIVNNAFQINELVYVPKRLVKDEQFIKADDILITMSSGSKTHIGKVALANKDMQCAFGAFCGKLIVNDRILSKYLYFLLTSGLFRSHIETQCKGTNINNLKKEYILGFQFALPAIQEQARIVARIEEMVSQLESGVGTLRQTKEQLAVYRQAVLKEAFDSLASDGEKYAIKDVCHEIKVGIVIKPAQYYTDADHGVKAFRSANVREFRINDSDWVYLSHDGHAQNKRSEIHTGDVLIVRSGYPGTACVVNDKFNGCNAIDILIAVPNTELITPEYLCAYTNSPYGRKLVSEKKRGVAQAHLNVGGYSKMQIPVPSIETQNQIVSEIASRLSMCDQIEQTVDAALQQAEALRQSILKKAFEGGL